MGLWFRIRLGPFGYTVRGRKRQSYRQYKAARDRRSRFAKRYERDRASASPRSQKSDQTTFERVFSEPPGGAKTEAGRVKYVNPEYARRSVPTLRAWLRYWRG